MGCTGTCTVRIYQTRALTLEKFPSFIDEAVARRFLEGVVQQSTRERPEAPCKGGCDCVPLAVYLPDEDNERKIEPAWSAWRLRNVIARVGDDEREGLIFGTVESCSAIVPGLCEDPQYDDLVSPGRKRPKNRSGGKGNARRR
jgi:hypothetical protein